MFIASNIYYIFQGDTSPIWNSRIKIGEDIIVMDPTWECKLQVKKNIDQDETPLIDKTIAYDASTNSFPCVLEPSETAILEPGDYYVFIEISNLAHVPPIRKERHLLLKVKKQGVHN